MASATSTVPSELGPHGQVQSKCVGKNVHTSVDGRLLCSFSGKVCMQRRLNGYAFCVRHIHEDNSAPFKRCQYVARYNNSQCTGAVPVTEDRIYCNSHLQVLGLVPKKCKKRSSLGGIGDSTSTEDHPLNSADATDVTDKVRDPAPPDCNRHAQQTTASPCPGKKEAETLLERLAVPHTKGTVHRSLGWFISSLLESNRTSAELRTDHIKDLKIRLAELKMANTCYQREVDELCRCAKPVLRRLIQISHDNINWLRDPRGIKAVVCSVPGCAKPTMALLHYCHKHALKEQSQVLFYPCGVSVASGSLCGLPTLGCPSKGQPVCLQHQRKQLPEYTPPPKEKKRKLPDVTKPLKVRKTSPSAAAGLPRPKPGPSLPASHGPSVGGGDGSSQYPRAAALEPRPQPDHHPVELNPTAWPTAQPLSPTLIRSPLPDVPQLVGPNHGTLTKQLPMTTPGSSPRETYTDVSSTSPCSTRRDVVPMMVSPQSSAGGVHSVSLQQSQGPYIFSSLAASARTPLHPHFNSVSTHVPVPLPVSFRRQDGQGAVRMSVPMPPLLFSASAMGVSVVGQIPPGTTQTSGVLSSQTSGRVSSSITITPSPTNQKIVISSQQSGPGLTAEGLPPVSSIRLVLNSSPVFSTTNPAPLFASVGGAASQRPRPDMPPGGSGPSRPATLLFNLSSPPPGVVRPTPPSGGGSIQAASLPAPISSLVGLQSSHAASLLSPSLVSSLLSSSSSSSSLTSSLGHTQHTTTMQMPLVGVRQIPVKASPDMRSLDGQAKAGYYPSPPPP